MISRKQFYFQLQRMPELASFAFESRQWEGDPISTFVLQQPPRPLDVTFEELMDQLSNLPRLYVELDGSFVWRGEDGGQLWQMDGLLHDSGQQVQYVEVKGTVDRNAWHKFTTILSSQRDDLVIHSVDRGYFMHIHEVDRVLWEPIG